MGYVIVAVFSLLVGGYLCYRYGRSVENKVWMTFMAARGFSEREFESAKKMYDAAKAAAKRIGGEL